ncbi:MAG: magnesium/cobalt transporter CorA [Actinomycetia bacterium]|nr:magnesium/cobalt transporter CorA [Actinomycetota bacterium]MCG2790596.1 magnesium/cobalt transporter CorA [Actinomycetes bacterium]
MKTLVYDRNEKKLLEKVTLKNIPSYINNVEYLIWIDIENPSKENMQFLRDHFHFHPLDIEDCLSIIERPKLDEYDDYFFLVLHIPYFIKQTRRLVPFAVNIFIGNNFLVTVHHGLCSPIQNTFDDLAENHQILDKGSGYLLHKVIDSLIDYNFPILNKIYRNVQDVEDAIFKKAGSKNVKDILLIRTNILTFRNIIFPQRKFLKTLEIKDMDFLIEALEVYFGDLVDHIEKIWDTLENYKELIEGVHDAHQSLLSNKINDIMRILTIFSVIILPLALISGIYGMNIVLPLERNPFAFIIIVVVMIIISIGMLVYFKYKDWI